MSKIITSVVLAVIAHAVFAFCASTGANVPVTLLTAVAVVVGLVIG